LINNHEALPQNDTCDKITSYLNIRIHITY